MKSRSMVLEAHGAVRLAGTFEQARKTGSMIQLKLPALSRFDKDIFNENWDAFVAKIKEAPDKKRKYEIKTPSIDISISLHTQRTLDGFGRISKLQEYNWERPLDSEFGLEWAGLESRSVGSHRLWRNTRILLCDGGSEFLKKGRRIIQEFFRTHPAIKFVLAFEATENFGATVLTKSRSILKIQVSSRKGWKTFYRNFQYLLKVSFRTQKEARSMPLMRLSQLRDISAPAITEV